MIYNGRETGILYSEGRMNYRIAVVDNEVKYSQELCALLEKYAAAHGLTVKIDVFRDGDEITEKYSCEYDIIFLDIRMDRLNGMETAKYIRRYDKEVLLIFLTNFSQFAIQGYEVDAEAYMLKPVDPAALERVLAKAFRKAEDRKASFAFFTAENAIVRIPVEEIRYVESFRHKMLVHAGPESYSIWMSMADIEKKLNGYGFVRCNRSYIVNLNYVENVNKSRILLEGGVYISVGAVYKQAFMDAFVKFMR